MEKYKQKLLNQVKNSEDLSTHPYLSYLDPVNNIWLKRDFFMKSMFNSDGTRLLDKDGIPITIKLGDIASVLTRTEDGVVEKHPRSLTVREKYFAEQEKKKDQYHAEIKALTIKNKQKITKMVNIFKPIAVNIIYLAAGFSLAFVGLGLYELGILLYNVGVWIFNLHFNIDWNTFFLLIGVIIGVVISVVLLVVVLDFIRNKFNNCCECRQKLLNFFSYFKYPKYLGYPVYYVYKFFELLWVMLKDNCPAIKWED